MNQLCQWPLRAEKKGTGPGRLRRTPKSKELEIRSRSGQETERRTWEEGVGGNSASKGTGKVQHTHQEPPWDVAVPTVGQSGGDGETT